MANRYRFKITVGGEGWKAIKTPATLWLYRAPAGEVLSSPSPAIRGLSPDGILVSVEVERLEVRGNKGWLELNSRWVEEHPSLEVRGSWLCIPREWLVRDTDDLYVFQLLGGMVRTSPESEDVAVVKDFFDSGAHGVLVLETSDGREFMIPFLDQFVEVRDGGHLLIIEKFYDFIP